MLSMRHKTLLTEGVCRTHESLLHKYIIIEARGLSNTLRVTSHVWTKIQTRATKCRSHCAIKSWHIHLEKFNSGSIRRGKARNVNTIKKIKKSAYTVHHVVLRYGTLWLWKCESLLCQSAISQFVLKSPITLLAYRTKRKLHHRQICEVVLLVG